MEGMGKSNVQVSRSLVISTDGGLARHQTFPFFKFTPDHRNFFLPPPNTTSVV